MLAGMTNRTDQIEPFCDLTPSEASRLSGVTPLTLSRMADRGELTISRPSGTHRRYNRSEIEALAKPVTR